jgi:hypothetical protein
MLVDYFCKVAEYNLIKESICGMLVPIISNFMEDPQIIITVLENKITRN